MKVDILFLAKNRLEFTRQALAALLANTNWSLVRRFQIVDDNSADGTFMEMTKMVVDEPSLARVHVTIDSSSPMGSPAEAMNRYIRSSSAEIVCKIDSDVIVPPRWLDQCAAVMEAHPELDLLGIEPPASRVPHREGMKRSPAPELVGQHDGYASCDSIGGIGLMRTSAFATGDKIRPHSIYGGFTEWQLAHPKVVKGWVCPPLKCFLLDRMPTEPWASLSRGYEAKGWQRPWGRYPLASKDALWGWWTPAPVETPSENP